MKKVPSQKVETGKRGFSLVLSLTIMTMILLLIMSLATFLSIEIQSSSTRITRQLAKNNALVGVRIALGQLQQYVGQDQRVTATAGILDSSETPNLSEVPHQHWVGVWNAGREQTGENAYSLPVERDPAGFLIDTRGANWRETRKTAEGRLKAWLVSGNEGKRLSDANYFSPTENLSDNDSRYRKITIVSSGTIDRNDSQGFQQGKVEVPTVGIKDQWGNTSNNVAEYAYWVSDEGVKAKFNLKDPYAAIQPSASAVANGGYYRLMASQRNNFDLVRDNDGNRPFSDFSTKETALISRAQNQNDFPLLGFTSAKGKFFHDTTFYSKGVLSNPVEGGLKRDFTAYFHAKGAVGGSGRLEGISDDQNILPTDHFDGTSPKYGLFRSWYESRLPWGVSADIVPPNAIPGTSGLYPIADFTNNSTAGVYPVLSRVNLYFKAAYDSSNNKVVMLVYPQIAIWNPYNVPLRGGRFRLDFAHRCMIRSIITYPGGNFAARFGNGVTRIEASGGTNKNSGNSVTPSDMVFHLEAPDMRPGQSLVFTPANSTDLLVPRNQAVGDTASNLLTPNGALGCLRSEIGDAPAAFVAAYAAGTGPFTVRFAHGSGGGYDWQGQWAVSGAGASYAYNNAPGHIYFIDCRNDSRVLQMVDTDTFSRGNLGRWVSMEGTSYTFENYAQAANSELPLRTASICFRLMWLEEIAERNKINTDINLFVQHNVRSPRMIRWPFSGTHTVRTNHENMNGFFVGETEPVLMNDNRYAMHDSEGTPFFSANESSPGYRYTLYDLPNRDLGVLSMGAFQHIPFSLFPWQSSLAFGNSYADPGIPSQQTSFDHETGARLWSDMFIWKSPGTYGPAPYLQSGTINISRASFLYDLSYELNNAVWDKWFVSGVPESYGEGWTSERWPAGVKFPNARLEPTAAKNGVAQVSLYRTANSLLLDGAFNINSTSVSAWTAFLSSFRDITVNIRSGQPVQSGTPYLRNLLPELGPANLASNASFDRYTWGGYRALTDQQLEELAKKIVQEVKFRGPFLGLADFINRRLVPYNTEHPRWHAMGTLQAAIEESGLNDAFKDILMTKQPFQLTGGSPAFQDIRGNAQVHLDGGTAVNEVDHKAAGAPGYLLQSDLLQQLAPAMTARSDTFVIRCYGNTLGLTGSVASEAWLEAIVQRFPEPVIPDTEAMSINPKSLQDGAIGAQLLGRRFKIIQMRWLAPSEI